MVKGCLEFRLPAEIRYKNGFDLANKVIYYCLSNNLPKLFHRSPVKDQCASRLKCNPEIKYKILNSA